MDDDIFNYDIEEPDEVEDVAVIEESNIDKALYNQISISFLWEKNSKK